MKRTLSLLLTAALTLSLLAGCGPKPLDSASEPASGQPGTSSSSQADGSVSAPGDSSSDSYQLPRFMVLSGPTGVGAAKLMADGEYAQEHLDENGIPMTPDGKTYAVDSITVVTDNTEVTYALTNKDVDIAAIATNAAAMLYAQSDGSIQVLAINTLGVLYILEKGDTVHSMADLAGKTLYAPSNTKGANPEHILNHLLQGNGVDPSQVNIQWLTPAEITAQITSSDAGICMLPVPAATALMVQDSAVREAVHMGEAWQDLEGILPMGCLVARTEYVQENPQAVEDFMTAYHESVAYMNDPDNTADAAQLVADLGIAPNAKVAEKAIPQCSLAFMTGIQMKDVLERYYTVLFQMEPKSIGGGLPYDDFYYGVG